jgi:hypothetical protein
MTKTRSSFYQTKIQVSGASKKTEKRKSEFKFRLVRLDFDFYFISSLT